jgi:phosphoribosylformimino-5-aminoimidazole carboxamide ribotide isomerase
MTFEILPAIDLRSGRVVRLVQGDFNRETRFGDDPLPIAESFAAAGARTLHVVDLDGAMEGRPVQLRLVRSLLRALRGRIAGEVAGGLRTTSDVAGALDSGAVRAVVATAALHDAQFVASLVRAHGCDRVVVALDVRDGHAVGEGWREGATRVKAEDALRRLADAGVETFEVTAIERDGKLGGPNLRLLARLVALRRGTVIASGGIRSIDDLRATRDVGCAGAIVGRALYEGTLDLAATISELNRG